MHQTTPSFPPNYLETPRSRPQGNNYNMANFNCAHCFKDINGKNYVECFSCKLHLHHACIDVAEKDFDSVMKLRSRNLKIICNRCNVTLSSVAELRKSIDDIKSAMEERLTHIESLISTASISPTAKEELLSESAERSTRATNVILANVLETPNTRDVDIANDILQIIDSAAVVSPDDVERIGNSVNGRPRLLKLRFKSAEMARLVLRKRDALRKSQVFGKVFVRDDKTKQQQNYLQNLNQELKTMRANGIKNATIKYRNNVPRIVTTSQNTSTPEN